jgi:hypothetical protein
MRLAALPLVRRCDAYVVHALLMPAWSAKVGADLVRSGRWPGVWVAAWAGVAAALWVLSLPVIACVRRRRLFPAAIVPAIAAYVVWATPPLVFVVLASFRLGI